MHSLDHEEQDLLLLAAVAPRPGATAAWEKWKNHYLTSNHNQLETRFTPEIFRRWKEWNLEDENLALLKKARQTTWFRNNALSQKTIPFLRLLKQNGIPFHLLKGSALINTHLKDYGYRYIRDIDILIPRGSAQACYELALGNGWQLLEDAWVNFTRAHHALSFGNQEGATIDLHWHILPYYQSAEFDKLLLQNSIETEIGNIKCKVLGLEEQLFHTILHGQLCPHNNYWILDAKRLLELNDSGLNWDRISSLADKSKTNYLLIKSLRALSNANSTLFNEKIIRSLECKPVSFVERMEAYAEENGTDSILGGLPNRIAQFARSGFALDSDNNLVSGILEFLCFQWNLASLRQLPRELLSRILSIFFRRVSKSESSS